jgi:hypothetical protein
MTWGVYEIAWGYKHWKLIKQRENSKINPCLRGIFLPFTLYWLAKKIFLLAEEKGSTTKFSAAAVVGLYWFLLVLSANSPNFLQLNLLILSFSPLLRVLRAANYFWEKEQPNLPVRKTLTIGEVAWIIFGIFSWLLMLFMRFSSAID